MKLSWKAAGALVAGGVLLGSVVSVAAQSPSPSPQASPAPKVRGGFKPWLRGAVRAEAVVVDPDGTVRTVRTDRGELRRVEGRTLTIAERDGTTVRVTVADDTRIVRDGAAAQLSDLREGDRVWTVRQRTGDGAFRTTAVKAISAERAAQLQEQRRACQTDPSRCFRPRARWFGRPGAAPGPAGDTQASV